MILTPLSILTAIVNNNGDEAHLLIFSHTYLIHTDACTYINHTSPDLSKATKVKNGKTLFELQCVAARPAVGLFTISAGYERWSSSQSTRS